MGVVDGLLCACKDSVLFLGGCHEQSLGSFGWWGVDKGPGACVTVTVCEAGSCFAVCY